ncbi:poly(A) RNA polymerase GLD2-like [Saccostrea cucullata]|uniref:poly(A) RNA polymerase GLD2-like n=1 Tax=Saccostrea cuccullata TaxID=36930 RepID=UPI002ED345EC
MNRRVHYPGPPGNPNSFFPQFNPTFRFSRLVQQQYTFLPNQHRLRHPSFLDFNNGWQNLQVDVGYPPVDYRETIRQDILSQLHRHPSTSHQNRKRSADSLPISSSSKKSRTDLPSESCTVIKDVPLPPPGYNPIHNITEAIIRYFLENHQTDKAYKQKLQLRDVLFKIFQASMPNCGLYIVGSSMSGFGTMKSDMDMCLMISEDGIDQKREAPELLYLIQKALYKCSFVRESMVIRAKVPILRFNDLVSKAQIDLNVNNSVGIRNTHLLKYYCMSKLLIKTSPVHKKVNVLTSKYACSPPVLPSLQELYPARFNGSLDIRDLKFDDTVSYKSDNGQSVGELFLGFLGYYSNKFKFDEDCISIKDATKYNLDDYMRFKNEYFQMQPLCIEEPFDMSNTARSCHDKNKFDRVKKVFKTSYRELQKKKDVSCLFSQPF